MIEVEPEALDAAAKALHDLMWTSNGKDACSEAVAHQAAMQESYQMAEVALKAAAPQDATAQEVILPPVAWRNQALSDRLDQLIGWAKAGKTEEYYLMSRENVDRLRNDIIGLVYEVERAQCGAWDNQGEGGPYRCDLPDDHLTPSATSVIYHNDSLKLTSWPPS